MQLPGQVSDHAASSPSLRSRSYLVKSPIPQLPRQVSDHAATSSSLRSCSYLVKSPIMQLARQVWLARLAGWLGKLPGVSGGQACLHPSAAERKSAKEKNVYGISSSVKSCSDVCLFVVVVVTYLKFLATPTPRNQLGR